VADERVLSGDEQLRLGREQFESATDFTVAIEEEFAILDPETLALTDGFEELQVSAKGSELEPHLVGELIASEVEIRTGRCETFAEAAALVPIRRAQLRELADRLGVTLGATGAHPWSPWQEQRIIDTPHYRVRDELLRYVVWRNNTFGIHVHVAINGPDRAVRVSDGLRAYLPELLALSASSPFLEHVNTGLHSVRTQIFTRFFPRCGVPDVYGDWRTFEEYVRFLFATGSIREHTEMWWSVRPHLAFPTVEIRICDAQPLQDEAISLAAFAYSLTARLARALDEGEELLLPPHREIEENFWRAIRWGLAGELIDLRTHEVRPARAAIEDLIEWVQPVAEELGAAEYLAVPAANAAERQIARFEEGASLEEIYAEEVRPKEAVSG
jgi:carboxylate-amine ligase